MNIAMIIRFNSRASEAWEGPRVERRALQVRIRLGKARERKGRALQVGVRLGRAL
jgi:hypothetical protein